MAFNPFDVFRRNQRILFALLTVVVMFMFILSFGQGDFFDMLPRYIGSKKRGGDVLAVVDGAKVFESDLTRVRDRRTLANQYMAGAGARAAENLGRYVADALPRVSAENKPAFEQLLRARPYYINPQIFQLVQMGLYTQDQVVQQREQTIALLQAQFAAMTGRAPKEDDKEVARAAQSLVDLDVRLSANPRQGLYFSNQPLGTGYKDLLEFQLWLRKADQMGVVYTPDDVGFLVNAEFFKQVTDADYKAVEDGLRGKTGYSPDLLRSALADEFKVRTAQAAVLGQWYLRPLGRAYDAPYDYYEFYKQQTSPGRFGLIPVPADNFVPQVKGTPTETELRDIFGKAKNLEPVPSLARPGLKEPRKVKLEWLEATGAEPFYKAAADEGLLKAGAVAKVAGFLAPPAGGVGAAGLLGAPAPLTVPDVVLAQKYAEYTKDHDRAVQGNWYLSQYAPPPKPLDNAVLRPANLGSLAGLLAGAGATAAGPLPAAAGFVGEAFLSDRQARAETLPASLIAPVAPGLGLPPALLATAAAQAAATRPLPVEAVRGQLAEKAMDDTARRVCNGDLVKFAEELTKLAGKEAEARTYVDGFVKARGLKAGKSDGLRDVYHLIDDPGLAPLKARADAAAADPFHSRGGGVRYVDPAAFGRRFFFERDPLDRTGREQAATGLFKPQPYPQTSLAGLDPLPTRFDSVFLAWRTADQPAEAPRAFTDPGVKEKAEAAWRRGKARELAKQFADDLARQCKDLGTNFIEVEMKLRDLDKQVEGKLPSPPGKPRPGYFEIPNVAPLVSTPLPMAGRDQVTPFGLAPSVNLPYPTVKMAEELVKAKDQPLSTALVLADQPEDTQYVAVLVERAERSPDQFGTEVFGALTGGDLAGAVSRRHQDELRKQARDQAVALLKAEFKYDKENTAKLADKADPYAD